MWIQAGRILLCIIQIAKLYNKNGFKKKNVHYFWSNLHRSFSIHCTSSFNHSALCGTYNWMYFLGISLIHYLCYGHILWWPSNKYSRSRSPRLPLLKKLIWNTKGPSIRYSVSHCVFSEDLQITPVYVQVCRRYKELQCPWNANESSFAKSLERLSMSSQVYQEVKSQPWEQYLVLDSIWIWNEFRKFPQQPQQVLTSYKWAVGHLNI
jgi:hypothetical protein